MEELLKREVRTEKREAVDVRCGGWEIFLVVYESRSEWRFKGVGEIRKLGRGEGRKWKGKE